MDYEHIQKLEDLTRAVTQIGSGINQAIYGQERLMQELFARTQNDMSFSKLSEFLSIQYPGAIDEYHKWAAVQRQINAAIK